MDKFVIRSKKLFFSHTSVPTESLNIESPIVDEIVESSRDKRARTETTNESDIISDPSLRKPINDYDPQIIDNVRREYVVKGPCQPLSHNFPKVVMANTSCFRAEWFKKWEWLEYSVSKDAAFCFWCYLFRGNVGKRFGDEVFVKSGFRNWKKASEKFRDHVGGAGSPHNEAQISFFSFKDQRQSLTRRVIYRTRELNVAYRARLTISVDIVRLLFGQGLAFRGHDESKCSLNKGNFLEVLDWYSSRNPDVQKEMKINVPENHKLTSPQVQKEIVSACASETTKAIISDIGEKIFSLLIDEARDSSVKEQMAIVVRYVKNNGVVVERFLGVVHVIDTTALSLKCGVDEFFAKHGLSISKLRGQGYDGASNMRGELNGLKTLVLNENPYARYIHCFAHQLQLVVVAVSHSIQFVSNFFEYLSMITNMVGASCKRKDEFRQKQHEHIVEKLEKGEIETGRGLNQETTLARPGATRWGSHYTTIIRLLSLWSSTTQVLENIFHDGTELKTRGVASSLVEKMESYQFIFIAHLMKVILGLTNVLSQFLQKKDQNIIAAVSLIQSTKRKLLELRNEGWDEFLQSVKYFCTQNQITILNMQEQPQGRFRSQRATTNEHHFRYDIFNEVIDRILMEMDNRFSESSTELLRYLSCLDPKDSFSNFSVPKLIQLAELYPQDFSSYDRMELREQLEMWISEMRGNEVFSTMQSIGDVSKKMVELGIHSVFQLVYRLIELVLVLPVATATVERVFSAMNIIKTDLRNKMGDDFLTDCLVCYIEKDVFRSIDNEVIIQHFQNMKTRRLDLSLLPSEEIQI